MNYWIFQSKPERYDLRNDEIIQKDKSDTWYATRYRSQMAKDDLVFFWLSGDPKIRGIYGIGKIISLPYKKENWDTYGIDVKYDRKLSTHISIQEINDTKGLENLLILRAPTATNFLLTQNEAEIIMNLFKNKN